MTLRIKAIKGGGIEITQDPGDEFEDFEITNFYVDGRLPGTVIPYTSLRGSDDNTFRVPKVVSIEDHEGLTNPEKG